MRFYEGSRITDALIRVFYTFKRYFPQSKRRFLIVGAIILVVGYLFFIKAPADFPSGEIISIEKGMTLSEISGFLHERAVIASPFFFKGTVVALQGEGGVVSGDYYLKEREGAFILARRLTKGAYGLAPKEVTLPEGTTIAHMAEILDEKFPRFNATHFKLLAENEEGYLFPDTYRFLPNAEASHIYEKLRETFDVRIAEIEDEIIAFGKPLEEVIVMASLLEEEARTTKTRRMIAGILWERLEIGMPLQVDAVFPYIIGKNTFEITLEDLEFDSPYNTYKYRGLPPAPITNPGLDAIRAAINPKTSPYLFYLSDHDGNVYYARDFEGHKANKRRYLQ